MVAEQFDYEEPQHIYRENGDGYCGCGEDYYYGNHYTCHECDGAMNIDFLRDPITDEEVWICVTCYSQREKMWQNTPFYLE